MKLKEFIDHLLMLSAVVGDDTKVVWSNKTGYHETADVGIIKVFPLGPYLYQNSPRLDGDKSIQVVSIHP